MLRTRLQPLHPIAWWCWAGTLAVAASRTTNPLLLGLIFAVVAWVVTTRRGNSPWARSFGALMRLGLFVIAIRVVVQVLFGDRVPGTTWFSLPSVPLPSWAAGVTIGGPVTAQATIGAFCQGLQIAVILACFGAANSLASSFRLLRCVPAGLYEVAVAVTVAITFTPQVVLSIARVRDARRLRGRATRGLKGWRGLAVPVLDGALERSVALAASMDARGFGRRSTSPRRRQATAAATLGGLVGLGIGLFQVLDSGSASGIGLAVILVGGGLVVGGLVASSHGSRSRYRPDCWLVAEWLVVAAGLAAVAGVVAAGSNDPNALVQPLYPLALPAGPIVALAGILLATVPSAIAPVPLPVRAKLSEALA
ncbi:MAG: energy-coupling factor transporter transmembrane component T [Acidimicrobiales bacterium]|jgi:energy-coupling factor transport system permease protein